MMPPMPHASQETRRVSSFVGHLVPRGVINDLIEVQAHVAREGDSPHRVRIAINFAETVFGEHRRRAIGKKGNRMQVTIDKAALAAIVKKTKGAVDARSMQPALTHLLLTAEGGKLSLFGTDLYLSATAEDAAEINAQGRCAVDAVRLAKVIAKMPSGAITLRHEGRELTLTAGRACVTIPAMDSDRFSETPAPGGLTWHSVSAATLADMIRGVSAVMPSDEPRPHLAGALTETDGGTLRLLATDGHRLSKVERSGAIAENAEIRNSLISSRTVRQLAEMIGSKPEAAAT